MPDPKQHSFWQDVFTPGTMACAVLCSIVGLLVALSLLWIGFWKTALLCVCLGIGWFCGAVQDKPAFFRKLLGRFINRH